ncbi:MAG TPA: winged helix DNA-binding domain-containing protein, partial [Kofleriaceae bacterium]|nr:winged helix DNA-binding domain-containing protein [Kofleriaceae bacterium]
LVQVPTDDPWAFPGAAAFAVAEHHLGTKLGNGTLHAIVRRYLAAFGPASVADAQTWSGIAGLGPVFDELRPELVTAKDGKRELFDLRDAPRPEAKTTAPVRFLPDFDNLVLGHADRSRLIDDEHRGRVTTKNLQVRATVLVDGRVAGTWTVERKKATATIVIEPFGPIAKKHRAAIEQEGEALARFVEPEATTFAVR